MTEAAFDTRKTEFRLSSLPLWRGVQDTPGVKTAFPFRLGWDDGGFVHQTTPKKVLDYVISDYVDPEYQYMTPPPGRSAWANRLGDGYVAAIKDMAGDLAGLRVLEIGAGSTYIAERLIADCGVEEYVIVDPAVRDEATGGRIEIVANYYPCRQIADRKFDLVVALNCLEHVEDPIDFLSHVQNALDGDSAKAVLVYPDVTQQFAQGDLNALLHEHLNYFDDPGTHNVLAQTGLAPKRYYSNDDTWFVLAERVNETAADPGRSEFNLLSSAIPLFERAEREGGRAVREKLAAGNTVLFHGAVNGLNTFFHLTGLGEHQNIRLVDGDEAKAGRFLPACGQSVQMPSAEAYETADTVCISAMTFYNEIRRDLVDRHNVPEEKIAPLFQCPESGGKGKP